MAFNILAHFVNTGGGGDLVVQGTTTAAIIDSGMISFDGGVTFQPYTYLGQGNYRGTGQSGEFIRVGSQIYAYSTDDPTGPLQNGNWKIQENDLDPSMPPCFVRGTLIAAPDGEVAVEDLKPGDSVMTSSGRPARILWTGCRKVAPSQVARDPALAPVRIEPETFGNKRCLLVSQQHRLLIRGYAAELWFGVPELLIPAKALLARDGISLESGLGVFWYHHLLLETHEVIIANGVHAESLHLGDQIDDRILRDVEDRMPGWIARARRLPVTRLVASVQEARVLVS